MEEVQSGNPHNPPSRPPGTDRGRRRSLCAKKVAEVQTGKKNNNKPERKMAGKMLLQLIDAMSDLKAEDTRLIGGGKRYTEYEIASSFSHAS